MTVLKTLSIFAKLPSFHQPLYSKISISVETDTTKPGNARTTLALRRGLRSVQAGEGQSSAIELHRRPAAIGHGDIVGQGVAVLTGAPFLLREICTACRASRL
jgi:hypothetical protein